MQDIIKILTGLLARPQDAEELLRESRSEPRLPDPDFLLDQYFEIYEGLVRVVSAAWGPPDFDDGMANGAFPTWYEAEFLATWVRGTRVAYLALRHDDNDLPLAVVAGVRSGVTAVRRTKTTRVLSERSEALTSALSGRTVTLVRCPAKSQLVVEFSDGSFLVVEASGNSLGATARAGTA